MHSKASDENLSKASILTAQMAQQTAFVCLESIKLGDLSAFESLEFIASKADHATMVDVAELCLDEGNPQLYNPEKAKSWLIAATEKGSVVAGCYLLDGMIDAVDRSASDQSLNDKSSRETLAIRQLVSKLSDDNPDKPILYQKYAACFSEVADPEQLDQIFGKDAFNADDWYLLGNAQWAVWHTKKIDNFKAKNVDCSSEEIQAHLNAPEQQKSKIRAVLPHFLRAVQAGDLRESLQVIQKLFEGLTLQPLEQVSLFAAAIPKDGKFSKEAATALLEKLGHLLPNNVLQSVGRDYPELAEPSEKYIKKDGTAGETFFRLAYLRFIYNQQKIDKKVRELLSHAPENTLVLGAKTLISQWDTQVQEEKDRLDEILLAFKSPSWIEWIFSWFESKETQNISNEVVKELSELTKSIQEKSTDDPCELHLSIQQAIKKVLQTHEADLSYRISWRLQSLLSDMESKLLPTLNTAFSAFMRDKQEVSDSAVLPAVHASLFPPIVEQEDHQLSVKLQKPRIN